MDRRLYFTLVAFAFTLFAIYLVYSIISPFLAPLVFAAVICSSTYVHYQWLLGRLGGRRNIAASAMTIAVIVTFVGPLVGISFLLSHEAAQVSRHLEALSPGGGTDFFSGLSRHRLVAPVIDRVSPYLSRFDVDLHGAILSGARGVMSLIVNYSGEIAKNVVGFLLKTIILVIALYFTYRDGDSFQRKFWSVVPLEPSRQVLMTETMSRVLGAVVYGIFLTCMVQGTLGGIGFWITGLPAPVLFGAVMAVFALLPVGGTAFVWVPGVVYLFLQGRIWQGIFLVIWGSLAISSIDNVIRPLFISGRARMSVLVVALGVLGGLFAFGFAGIVLGPIVLALFIALFDMYRRDVYPGGTEQTRE